MGEKENDEEWDDEDDGNVDANAATRGRTLARQTVSKEQTTRMVSILLHWLTPNSHPSS